jgi:hypothetical protein
VSISVLILNDVSQWEISLNHHPISIEVMFQLLGCNQYDVDQLLNLWVPSFGLIEHLVDEVDRALDFVHVARFFTLDHDDCGDHVIDGRNVEKKNIVFLRGYKD